MCKKLLFSDFNFIDPLYYDEDLIKNYDKEKSDYCALLEVDIEYPKSEYI